MKVFWIELTCDHVLLILAHTPEGAEDLGEVEAAKHGTKVIHGTVKEVLLDEPRLLAWVPGPWSADAVG